jgi:hypothetical protein
MLTRVPKILGEMDDPFLIFVIAILGLVAIRILVDKFT